MKEYEIYWKLVKIEIEDNFYQIKKIDLVNIFKSIYNWSKDGFIRNKNGRIYATWLIK